MLETGIFRALRLEMVREEIWNTHGLLATQRHNEWLNHIMESCSRCYGKHSFEASINFFSLLTDFLVFISPFISLHSVIFFLSFLCGAKRRMKLKGNTHKTAQRPVSKCDVYRHHNARSGKCFVHFLASPSFLWSSCRSRLEDLQIVYVSHNFICINHLPL